MKIELEVSDEITLSETRATIIGLLELEAVATPEQKSALKDARSWMHILQGALFTEGRTGRRGR
jgi:hypothetical protein